MAKKHSLKQTRRRKHRRGGADDMAKPEPLPQEDRSIYKDVDSDSESDEERGVEESESESDDEKKGDKDSSIYNDFGGKRRKKGRTASKKKKSRKTRKQTKKSRKHRK
jgi:hypothetical protein